MALGTGLPALLDDQRRLLESWLLELGQNWNEQRLAALVSRVPAAPWRLTALLELAKLDLERQWQRGRRVPLADYLQRFPELARAEAVVTDLARAEAELRGRFGETLHPSTTRATSRPPGAPGDLPEQFGRYRIVKKLGQGGM